VTLWLQVERNDEREERQEKKEVRKKETTKQDIRKLF
jgi:hypothetical protein